MTYYQNILRRRVLSNPLKKKHTIILSGTFDSTRAYVTIGGKRYSAEGKVSVVNGAKVQIYLHGTSTARGSVIYLNDENVASGFEAIYTFTVNGDAIIEISGSAVFSAKITHPLIPITTANMEEYFRVVKDKNRFVEHSSGIFEVTGGSTEVSSEITLYAKRYLYVLVSCSCSIPNTDESFIISTIDNFGEEFGWKVLQGEESFTEPIPISNNYDNDIEDRAIKFRCDLSPSIYEKRCSFSLWVIPM